MRRCSSPESTRKEDSFLLAVAGRVARAVDDDAVLPSALGAYKPYEHAKPSLAISEGLKQSTCFASNGMRYTKWSPRRARRSL